MKGKKWYQKISNWIFIAVLLILLPILATNLYIMFQANNDKDKVPNIFGYKPFIVLSGSMETEIRVGDMIITKMINPDTLKKDDVIAFRDHENTVTTHRIIDILEKDGNKYFVTKGDNNDSQDENLVEYKDVEGIYITRIPGVGNIFNELAKPTTIIILVLGVTVIFILLFQISNKKLKGQEQKEFLEYKKQKKEQKETLKKSKQNKEKEKKRQEFVVEQRKFQEQQKIKEEQQRKQEEQEFLEYKKMKEEQRRLEEEKEFLEYKRMKEEKQRQQERREFLEYKRQKEEKKNLSNQKDFSTNNNRNRKHNYNKSTKPNGVKSHKKNKKYTNNRHTSK